MPQAILVRSWTALRGIEERQRHDRNRGKHGDRNDAARRSGGYNGVDGDVGSRARGWCAGSTVWLYPRDAVIGPNKSFGIAGYVRSRMKNGNA
jgi:hypothetical protein